MKMRKNPGKEHSQANEAQAIDFSIIGDKLTEHEDHHWYGNMSERKSDK